MKVKINKKDKKTIEVEIEGVRHTLPDIIRNELWNDNSVTLAAYERKHPFLGVSKLIIKSKNPKKSLDDAIKRTENTIKKFRKEFSRSVK